MSSKKLSPEEELEKQYRDYKAQFEQWKEKNKNSEGTEAYEKYVQQFRDWERDVEKRRAAVRQKAMHDKQQVEREKAEKEEDERRKLHEEMAAANAYAEQQKQYMAMHQKAMQEDEARRARQSAASQAVFQAHAQSVTASQTITPKPEPADANAMMSVMQQMMTLMEGEQKQNGEEAIKSGPHIQADPQPAVQPAAQTQEPAAPPQLWGADGANYTPTDPLFLKWNVRAAPPNFKVPYQPPPHGTPIVPGWLLIQEMQANSLIFPPPPPVAPLVPPPLPVPVGIPPPVPNFAVPPPVGMPPMNVPPPTFSIS